MLRAARAPACVPLVRIATVSQRHPSCAPTNRKYEGHKGRNDRRNRKDNINSDAHYANLRVVHVLRYPSQVLVTRARTQQGVQQACSATPVRVPAKGGWGGWRPPSTCGARPAAVLGRLAQRARARAVRVGSLEFMHLVATAQRTLRVLWKGGWVG